MASRPHFAVRFALPVPPDNDMQLNGPLVGVDAAVSDHHHSPGLEIMPNGDVLVLSFSGPGGREYGPNLRIVQARLRHGAEEFDLPEQVSVQGVRMQDLPTSDGKPALAGPPLLWREGSTVWLFTGWGREDVLRVDLPYSFRVFKSTDNGATWTRVALEPQFSSTNGDAQPINSAFRAPNGDMFVACDGKAGAGTSLLWRSSDNGLTWTDQGWRTSGRHSTIVPLDESGQLLSLGGKDTQINGYMPRSTSTDWGKTWSAKSQSPFPWLGANQRPSMIKLANGNLVMVGDARFIHTPNTAPHGWAHGDAPYVALSTDNGTSWTFKALPVALKHETRAHQTLGYATVRQAPNGVIHVLATMTHPCLHYEFNEAWITDPSAGDIAPEITGGTVQSYSETYSGGAPKATWSARITPHGRYLLEGLEHHYYVDGRKQREVTWVSGRRSGVETLWGPDGTRIWTWNHDLAHNVSTWTHWWPNGQKRLESQWDTNPAARDLPSRRFRGLVANGTARHWNESGKEVGTYTFLNGVRTSPRGHHMETFATSPCGWTGNDNTSDGADFGWSRDTSWCENMNVGYMPVKGEVGGVFARSPKHRYYADTGIGTKNRTETLRFAGNLYLANENFDGTLRIGYFNTFSPESSFIGIEISEPAGTPITPMVHRSGQLFRGHLYVKGPGGTTSTVPLELEMNFLGATFDLTWAGNPDGSGTLSGTVTSRPVSITVAAGSGSFNAFGILAGGDSSDDPSKKTGGCYFDNLTYDKGAVTNYTVTYDANGATSGTAPANQTKTHGVTLTLAYNTGNLARPGYDFAGWSTTADSSGTNYVTGASFHANREITLYARWMIPLMVVKQDTAPALQGPSAATPYFNVRFALPIPPENDLQVNGPLVGVDPAVKSHHHSPGFEVMPNGDVLSFAGHMPGSREYTLGGARELHKVLARLRHGADEWEMPTEVESDIGGLLWRDGVTVWGFSGWGRSDTLGYDLPYRFRVNKSTDSGATWQSVAYAPIFSSNDADAQPIADAFRAPNGDMFVAVDAISGTAASLLYRSPDNGLTWHDQGGRTSGRHSTIAIVDPGTGRLVSLGGKDSRFGNTRYMPQNLSTDWGATWEAPTQSPFPWLGANQRPSIIRLASGNLVLVGDARFVHSPNPPPGWLHGDSPYVALSTNNGANWTIKALPVALKHETRAHKTLGYATVRQAPNGVIHVFATMTHPCLHYEFNEAWITDPSAGDIAPETVGGTVQPYSENYPGGGLRATWSARITANGRYLLDGLETLYYPNGQKQREVTWASGRRTGVETFWRSDGIRIYSWSHDPANNVSVWTHWWRNGQKRLESHWNTYPAARDLPGRNFRGMVAHGTARHWNESGRQVGVYTFLNGDRISPRGNHTESFATSPSGWTGSGNAAAGHNFGWSSNTSFCENRNSAYNKGEVGGVFARSTTYRYYADTSIGTKSRMQTLHLAGNLMLNRTALSNNYSGVVRIGYFNTSSPGSNFVGIEIREPSGTPMDPTVFKSGEHYSAYLAVWGSGGTVSSVPIELEMNFLGAAFDLIWKGNPDGSGTLSGTVTSLPISITVAAGDGSFNAFGILAGGDSGDDPAQTAGGCYFDNLTYDKGTVTNQTVNSNANGATGGTAPHAPDNLRVNDAISPVGTPDRVYYGWWVHDSDPDEVQSAYQILVSRTAENLADDTFDVWDSGRVDSDRQNHVVHEGAVLAADHRYHWKVRTWDKDGNVSPWSAPATFTVGLLVNDDWKGASWIKRDTTDVDDYTYYRKQVSLPAKTVERATIYVATMHQYALYFNDTLVGRGPAYHHPQYQYYHAYDVTALVRSGGINQLALLNHWFGGGQGRPVGSRGVLLKAFIRYADGTMTGIGTDGTWKQTAAASWVPPRTRRNHDAGYIERIDGRLLTPEWYLTSFDDGSWSAATVIGPQPVSPWVNPPAPDLTRITETVIAPASITHKGDGTYLIDLGKTYTGMPRIRFSGGTAGDEVRMRGGDILDSSGLLPIGTLSQNTDMEYRAFLTRGEFIFEPFEYLGMRYFQIDNAPMPVTADNFELIFRHALIDSEASSFTSPNPMLNAVWELMKHSVVVCAQEQFVDTPTREKGGFLRDAAIQSTVAMPTLGERLLTRRSLGEFLQSMDQHWSAPADRGRINAVYPNNDGARDIPDFTQAFPIWVWNYYMESGDLAFLAENYSKLRNVVDYVDLHGDATTGLVTNLTGGSGPYLHGIIDWPLPMRYGYDMATAARTVVNGWAYAGFDIMSRIAKAVGNASDQEKYRAKADKLAHSINARLINDAGLYSDGLYANGSQSANTSQHANLFPLALGIVPRTHRDTVVAEVKNRRMSVGMVTVSWLVRALGEARQGRHLIELFTNIEWDGWARCLTLGATTTWESWTSNERHTSESMSHGWGGAGMEGYYRYILGIVPTAPQYMRLEIRPLDFGERLASAAGHIRTDRGDVHVQWLRAATSHTLNVRLPVNITANIYLPRGSSSDWQVLLDGVPVATTVINGQIKVANVGSGSRTLIRKDLNHDPIIPRSATAVSAQR